MKKGFFDIKEKNVIWLYGAGCRGEKVCNVLTQQGYDVVGFIDQRALELEELCGKRVFSVIEALERINEEDVLILCLQNGLQQELVAAEFAEHGIYNILYLPMESNVSVEVRSIYRRKYFSLISGECTSLKNIPMYQNTGVQERDIIRRTDTMTIFWCDVSSIYSSCFLHEKEKAHTEESLKLMDMYSDVPMEELIPYRNLFRYLSGEDASYIEYMLLQERLERVEVEKLIQDRKQLFQIYEEAVLYDMSLFMEAPAVVEWNVNGYFNVCDGMHRIQYLMMKGYQKVPVATKHEMYKEYMG